MEANTDLSTEKGIVIIPAREIYGLNISGAEPREKLSETLKSLGCK